MPRLVSVTRVSRFTIFTIHIYAVQDDIAAMGPHIYEVLASANTFGKTAATLLRTTDFTSTAAREKTCSTGQILTIIQHILPSRPKAGGKP